MNNLADSSRQIIRKGSKSFSAAARLFDETTRYDVYMLYAWCRHCDDEIDGQELGFGMGNAPVDDQADRLEQLRATTNSVLDGGITYDQAFQGLQRVVNRYDIPKRYPLELLEGFAMDVEGKRYRTLQDTLLYSYHVAGVVGIMMAYVMGVRDPATLRRAADLGIAFQLTNIVRDVMDDARAGRVYLPEDWLEEAGVSSADILEPRHRSAVYSVAKRLLLEADRYYQSAREGVPALPVRAAWAIRTAGGVYRDIGELVRDRGAAAWDERAIVSRPRKFYWVVRGGLSALKAVSLGRRRSMSPRREGLWIKPDIV